MDATAAEIDRFNSKIKPSRPGECMEWSGPLDRDGYGSFFWRGAPRRAHRFAFALANGSIPEGAVINHACRNPSCVNHQHLQAVTLRDNALRDSTSRAYLNSQKTHCPEGHAYDRKYGKQRYCSVCQAAKSRKLRAKWKAEGRIAPL